jgi:hypothetical protein
MVINGLGVGVKVALTYARDWVGAAFRLSA